MAYASVISQPAGSAARNARPVLDALAPLVGSSKRVLELASFPYEHIRHYAERWPEVVFNGTVRDPGEMKATRTDNLPPNVGTPVQLDIAVDADWTSLRARTTEPYDGVIMINLVHCTPEGLPEHVFRSLSPKTAQGRTLLAKRGWIAAYGAYLNDDGSFRSPGDEKFDREYIKGVDPSLGLRTPVSITRMAEKWGFVEEVRQEMPKGNLWMVWRAVDESVDEA